MRKRSVDTYSCLFSRKCPQIEKTQSALLIVLTQAFNSPPPSFFYSKELFLSLCFHAFILPFTVTALGEINRVITLSLLISELE